MGAVAAGRGVLSGRMSRGYEACAVDRAKYYVHANAADLTFAVAKLSGN
jgi:hypothetical protein